MRRRTLGLTLAGAAAAVVLGTGSTVALHAMAQPGTPFSPTGVPRNAAAACSAPALPGTTTRVTLIDMGAGMTGPITSQNQGAGGRGIGFGGMSGRNGFGGMGGGGFMGGGMAVTANPTSVHAGTVSLLVANQGSIVHELVVLPLPGDARPGERRITSDDRVSETNSLGEASTTCGAGAGDGINPGSQSWVSLDLKPGRYELVCNIPGHYAAGMYAELDVTT